WQMAECHRRSGVKAIPPAGPDTAEWGTDFPPRRAFWALAVELQRGRPCHQAHAHAAFMQQGCDVQGGGTRAENRDVASLEWAQVMICTAVGQDLGGQVAQLLRDLWEVVQAGGNDNAPRAEAFAVVQP